MSQRLNRIAAFLGEEQAWQQMRDAIGDGRLPARCRSFGIDRQPLQPEWMRLLIWDDGDDDAMFFRAEKGIDLVPPMRVPEWVTNTEVSVAASDRLWPSVVVEPELSRSQVKETNGFSEGQLKADELLKDIIKDSTISGDGAGTPMTTADAGRRSATVRSERYQAARKHALGFAADIVKADPTLSNSRLASEIEAHWKLEEPKCPGHRWLQDLISAARKDKRLPVKKKKKS
jgi:hypothetical protein